VQIQIVEDTPGEIQALTAQEIVAKLYIGMTRASEQLLKGHAERGGEIDALETLRVDLHKGFEARLEAIRAGLIKDLGDGAEGA